MSTARPPSSCLAEAWRAHQAELRAYLAHRTGDADGAEDLLQEVFIKALRQGSAFCRVEQPRAWLFQVARNALADAWRGTRPEIPLPDDIAQPQADVDGGMPVDALTGCMSRVLQEMAPQDAQILRACDLDGRTVSSFAQEQGLGLPAAKSRLLRARKRLRDRMTQACQVQFDADGRVSGHTPRA